MKIMQSTGGSMITVQKAVELTGLSVHTLRYYERMGLIPSVRRDESSKHRLYSTEDIARLESLSCMRALGMRLAEMKAYLAMASRGKKVSRQMLTILERQQARLQERLAETQRYIKYTNQKLAYWHAMERGDERTAAAIAARLMEQLRSGRRS